MMKIEKLEPSPRKPGRVLAFLEDGSILKLTEQELLDFDLRAGAQLDEMTIKRLQAAADGSDAKAQAAALIGRRAMSRADLMKKLRDKGASENDARYAAEWLEAIGALNDADFAALLVCRSARMSYGPARWRDELRRHGVDRALWEDAVAAAPPLEDILDLYLADRFRGQTPDETERRRAADALARRGFPWGEVKAALYRCGAETPEETP